MWFELAIVSMLAYGIQDFLFKLAEVRNLDFRTVLTVYTLTVLLVSIVHYFVFPLPVPFLLPLALFALVQVTFFLAMTVLKLEALDNMPSLAVFPLFALGGGVGAAILTAVFLGAPLTPYRMLGIMISAAALLLLIERKRGRVLPKGLLFAFVGLVCFAISNFFVAAVSPEYMVPSVFIALSSAFAVGPYYLLESKLHKHHGKLEQSSRMGVAIGLVNAFAFFSFIYALSAGPATVVLPIVGMALLVSIILSKLAFDERLTARRTIAITLAIVAIILIRLNI